MPLFSQPFAISAAALVQGHRRRANQELGRGSLHVVAILSDVAADEEGGRATVLATVPCSHYEVQRPFASLFQIGLSRTLLARLVLAEVSLQQLT